MIFLYFADIVTPPSSESEIQKRTERAVHQIARHDRQQSGKRDRFNEIQSLFSDGLFLNCDQNLFHDRRRSHQRDHKDDRIASQIIERGRGNKRQSSNTEEPSDIGQKRPHILRSKQNEAEKHEREHVDMVPDSRLFQIRQKPKLFDQQANGKEEPPENKVPRSTVPEARQHPDDENIEKPSPSGNAVTAERNIYVITEPRAQRHMPSAPEFGDASRNEGIIEIFEKIKAEDLTQTDRHIAVSRKVEVDLERKRDRVKPEKQNGFFIRCRKIGAKRRKRIRNQNLLTEAENETANALRRLIKAVRSFAQLSVDIRVADDRTRDQLGKKRNVGSQIDRILLRAHVASVDVHRIAEDLEGIEADPDRERDLQQGYGKPRHRVPIRNEKVGVFEIDQKSKRRSHGQKQQKLRGARSAEALDQQAEKIAEQNGYQHDDHVPRFSPGVEYQARQEQDRIFQKFRRDGVQQKHRR